MNRKLPFILIALLPLIITLLILSLTKGVNITVWNPQGPIALAERNMIITTVLLGLIVVLPVYISLFFIAWKYRSSNPHAKRNLEWTGNNKLKFLWWAFPTTIIVILAILTWNITHKLDPYKPLDSQVKPINVQVVALRWKWLFIYPEQNIASVNLLEFPVHTPVNFELTADAPFSSFWIPSLGGQIYAMSAMTTKTHLIADNTGDFLGENTEINGDGFAGMKFIARSTSQENFEKWIAKIKLSAKKLDENAYNKLASPSENNPVTYYWGTDQDLYNKIVTKYLSPRVNVNEY